MAACENLKIPKFNLTQLWDRTQIIYKNCPDSGKLSTVGPFGSPPEQFQSLTYKSCTDIAGDGYGTYGKFDIWSRLSTWKFPLFQLIAVFPRPSLSARVELFVITHLLGDPIDTMTNLLLKLGDCQETASHWKGSSAVMAASVDSEGDRLSSRERLWKALSLVTDTYDEWSMGPRAKDILHTIEGRFRQNDKREAFEDLIIEVSEELAADKVTKILPTAVALVLFILTIAVSFLKTGAAVGGSGLNTSTFIGIEAHGIAFSALYFWIIPAVFLGSVIGTSQTENSIPRILKRFHSDLPKRFSDDGTDHEITESALQLKDCLRGETGVDERVYTGGIYTWRRQGIAIPRPHNEPSVPTEQEEQPQDGVTSADAALLTSTNPENAVDVFPQRERLLRYRIVSYTLPYLILGVALASGTSVSSRVPPDGLDCRVAFQIGICVFWILSGLANPLIRLIIRPTAENRKWLLLATFVKDVLFIIATLGSVYATVVGVLNKCYCWTKFGKIELVLPQRDDVNKTLQDRLKLDYPALIFSGISIELFVMPAIIWLSYPQAMSVFVQKDSDESNLEWWFAIKHWFESIVEAVRNGLKSMKRLSLRKPRRVSTHNPWGKPEEVVLTEQVAPKIQKGPGQGGQAPGGN